MLVQSWYSAQGMDGAVHIKGSSFFSCIFLETASLKPSECYKSNEVDNHHHRSKSNQFNLLNFMNLFLWIFMVFEFISSVFFTSPVSNLHVITLNKKETQVHHILQESKRNRCWTCLFTSKMFFPNSPQKLKFIPI